MIYRLFGFLESLIPAAVILLPILFYYLYKRNVLKTQKEILLKEIEKGGIVDPEMLAKSLTNPGSEEQRLQNNLRNGIIFSIAGFVIAVATIVFDVYLNEIYAERANGSTYNVDDLVPIALLVTLVLVVAAIALGIGIAFLVSYFNQKKRMNKTA